MSSCQHACADAWVFPKPIDNRPGLEHIQYRIGTYADFREAMLRGLNVNPVLKHWTYREPDDPGIAILEGAAVLGDILTFYQELYANEAFLRTAQWTEDIAALVRLLGYRLSPGLGGKAAFAFEVTGPGTLTIPARFPIQAQLAAPGPAADFETVKELKAYPELSRFSLVRPFTEPDIQTTIREFYLSSSTDPGFSLKAGDRLILGVPVPLSTLSPQAWQNAEIAVVAGVRDFHGVQAITIKGNLRQLHDVPQVSAYKLGRTFNHFGHNAPATKVKVDGSQTPPVVTAPQIDYGRNLDSATSAWVSPALSWQEFPLDRTIDDLPLNTPFVCQARFWYADFPNVSSGLTVVRPLLSVSKNTYTWGSLTGSASVLNFAEGLLSNYVPANLAIDRLDIRTLQLHETVSPLLALRSLPQTDHSQTRGKVMYFFGTEPAAQGLKDRPLIIQTKSRVIETSCVSLEPVGTVFGQTTSVWKAGLSTEIDYADFPLEHSPSTVFGNIAQATQGKTVKLAALGNGDDRQIFQTFKLPKIPLTYLHAVGQTPPEQPELEIYVNELKWQCVPSWFGRGPQEQIYIVREDETNTSWVQFGDGKTGSRLPSGKNNVQAAYRTGTGALGAMKPGVKPQAGVVLTGLDKIQLPGQVGFGSNPETGGHAKQAAPGKVQSLGRLVSIQDFEKEALAISGVLKARAAWELSQYSSLVDLTVLLQSGHAVSEVQALMSDTNRTRGPNRFPVQVTAGEFQYIYLQLRVGQDPDFQPDLLEAAIRLALGVSEKTEMDLDQPAGLLSLFQRKFNQDEYASRIEAVVQNVPGVRWAHANAFGSLGPAADPDMLVWPQAAALTRDEKVVCPATQVLALYKQHVKIQFVK